VLKEEQGEYKDPEKRIGRMISKKVLEYTLPSKRRKMNLLHKVGSSIGSAIETTDPVKGHHLFFKGEALEEMGKLAHGRKRLFLPNEFFD